MNISRSLINSINKVLNKDVDEHKAELRAISFPGFGQDYSHFTDLDAGLVKEIQEQIENCQKLIEQYLAAIQLKLNSNLQSGKYCPHRFGKTVSSN